MSAGADLGVDEIVDVLASGAELPLSPGVPVSQLDHALQTAALLAHLHPGDDELAAAGLVHDIGHLLPGGTDEAHATDAARAVRRALGERVAGMVGLHVAAKRYLVATEGGYGGRAHRPTAWSRWAARAAPWTRRRPRPSWPGRGRPTP